MEKILVVAAHPDDELLGLGGTIRRLANEGKEINAIILAEGITSRSESRELADKSEIKKLRQDAYNASLIVGYQNIDFYNFPDNRTDSVDLLDIIKVISNYINTFQPDTIFTHHHGDLNIDHQRICEAVLTACRPINGCKVNRIYAFETPSSTEWDFNYNNPFNPNVFFDVTDTFEAKLKGMACYPSEKQNYPHPRSEEALISLAKYRGSTIGFELAEAFMLLREKYS